MESRQDSRIPGLCDARMTSSSNVDNEEGDVEHCHFTRSPIFCVHCVDELGVLRGVPASAIAMASFTHCNVDEAQY